jgi:hypothetical protein
MSLRLVRLYPAAWRGRYGEEFAALLEERPLGPFDVVDIVLGALDAHLRLHGRGADLNQGRAFSMSLRIGGIAAIIGAALWPVGFFIAAGSVSHVGPIGPIDPDAARLLLMTGSLALLVALAGLTSFQARAHPELVWTAFALPAVGTIASAVGIVGFRFSEDFFVLWMLGTLATFVGSTLFAIATYRTAALSRWAALVLGVGSMLTLIFGMIGGGNPSPVLMIAALSTFGLGWFALGIQAIRLDRPAAYPTAA